MLKESQIIEECIEALKKAPLMFGLRIFESYVTAPSGRIPLPSRGEKEISKHAVAVVGYSREHQCFYFRDTYQHVWGYDGSIPFEYVEKGYVLEIGQILVQPNFKSEIPEKSAETSEKITQHEIDLKNYAEERKSVLFSGRKTLNSNNRDIEIDYKDSRLSSVIEQSLSQVTELGIELFDEEQAKKANLELERNYESKLSKGETTTFGGIGGPGQIVGFFIEAAIQFTALWIGKHVVDDLDDAIWKKLKNAFFNIFKSAQSIINEDKITITTNYTPQIIFVIPTSINPKIFLAKMDVLIKLTKEILEKNPDPSIAHKYTFNSRSGSWELEIVKQTMW